MEHEIPSSFKKKLSGSSISGFKKIGKAMWKGTKKVAKGTKKGLVFIDKALTGSKGSAWRSLKKPYKNRTLHIGRTFNGVVRYWESLESKGIIGGRIFKLRTGKYYGWFGFYTYQ